MLDNPARSLIDLSNACWTSRCLHTAVELRLADLVGNGGLTLEDLAAGSGAEARFIAAMLHVLSRKGVFSIEGNQVSHTDLSLWLRSDHPDSVAPIIDWMGSEEVWNAVGKMPTASRDAVSGFEIAHGKKLFEYLAHHPERFAVFDRQMAGFTQRDTAAVMDVVDFAPYARIADIGCGTGVLSKAIAKRYPSCKVLAFDLPGGGVCALRDHPGIEVVEGDFFVDPLPPAELTILSNILHDWPDAAAVAILASVRRSAPRGAHLCIIEGLLDSGEERVDLVSLGMAIMTGGRQRSRREYEELLSRAGFDPGEVVKCTEYVSVMRARVRT